MWTEESCHVNREERVEFNGNDQQLDGGLLLVTDYVQEDGDSLMALKLSRYIQRDVIFFCSTFHIDQAANSQAQPCYILATTLGPYIVSEY